MIHHAGRLALALPELAIALGVIGTALGDCWWRARADRFWLVRAGTWHVSLQ